MDIRDTHDDENSGPYLPESQIPLPPPPRCPSPADCAACAEVTPPGGTAFTSDSVPDIGSSVLTDSHSDSLVMGATAKITLLTTAVNQLADSMALQRQALGDLADHLHAHIEDARKRGRTNSAICTGLPWVAIAIASISLCGSAWALSMAVANADAMAALQSLTAAQQIARLEVCSAR